MADKTSGFDPQSPAPGPSRIWRSRIQPFSSLKSPDFRLLLTGTSFFHMAGWLQMLTLGWLVWNLTLDPETGRGSAMLSGAAAGLRGLPNLLIGPWAGVLTDRIDRRLLVVVVQLFLGVVAAVFGLIVASGDLQVWHAILYASVSAVFMAFTMPARQALIANTVPPGSLGNAFALNSMAVTAMRLIGTTVGGLLITTVGFKWNFFVEGGAYITMALLLIPMRTPYREASAARRRSVGSDLKDGISYIWKENRVLLHLMVLGFVPVLVFFPMTSILPAYTSEVLNADADVGGYLFAATGIGGFTAGLVIASMGFKIGKGKLGLVALIAGSVAILAFARSEGLPLSLAMMVFLGFCQSNFVISNQTLVQSMVPDPLRGRVTSIYMLQYGLGPMAIILMGLFMDLFTAVGALTVVAAVSLGFSIYLMVAFRQVRRLQ